MNKLDKITTSQLLAKHLLKEEGPIVGKCILCANETKRGLKIKSVISASFTTFELLQAGDCFCPDCASCFSPETRRSNWLVTEKEFMKFKRAEALTIFQQLPVEPFMISLTKNYKKNGFLFVANTINYSQENYLVAFEDRSLRINRKILEESLILIQKLRELKITKKELATGTFYPSAITKIIAAGLFEEISKVKNSCKSDNWVLGLFLSK